MKSLSGTKGQKSLNTENLTPDQQCFWREIWIKEGKCKKWHMEASRTCPRGGLQGELSCQPLLVNCRPHEKEVILFELLYSSAGGRASDSSSPTPTPVPLQYGRLSQASQWAAITRGPPSFFQWASCLKQLPTPPSSIQESPLLWSLGLSAIFIGKISDSCIFKVHNRNLANSSSGSL